jgi:hypothetical protein
VPWKMLCRSCNRDIVVRSVAQSDGMRCRYCGVANQLPSHPADATEDELSAYMSSGVDFTRKYLSNSLSGSPGVGYLGDAAIGALGGFAWFFLIVHILAALGIWAILGRPEVSGVSQLGGAASWEFNVIRVALSLGVLVEGIFVCVLCRALHWIGLGVIALRVDCARPN